MTTANLFQKTHLAAALAALLLTPGVMSAQALVKTIPLGPQPPFVGPHHELLVPAANRLYAVNGTTVATLEASAPAATPSLAIVDTAARTFRGSLPLPIPQGMGWVISGNAEPNRSTAFFVYGTKAYLAFSGPPNLPGVPPGATTGLIVVVDATTDTVSQTLPIPGIILNMVFNPTTHKFYVLEQSPAGAAQILVYDAATLTQLAVISNVNTSPTTLDLNVALNKIYASMAAPAAGVMVIDGVSDSVTAMVSLPDEIGTLIADPVNNKIFAGAGQFIWTTAYDLDGVTAQLNKVITTFPNTFFVENFAYVNPNTNQVIVGDSFQIDGVTDALTRVPEYGNFASPLNPHCNPMGTGDGAFDFALNNWYSGCDGSVLIADPATGNVKSTIPLSFVTEPTAFAVNPQTHIEYELSQMGNSVAIIDPVARTTSLVQLGNLPAGIAVNPVTNRVYVADASASAAVIIDGGSNTVIAKNFVEPNATSAVLGMEVNSTTNQYVFADMAGMAILNGATDAVQLLVNVDASGGSGNVTNKQTGLDIRALNPVTNNLYTAQFIAAAPSPTVYTTNLGFGGFVAFTDASCPVMGLAVNPATDWIYAASQCQGGPLLEVFDAGTKVLVQSLDLSTAWPNGSQIGKMVFNSQTGKLYIVNNGGANKNGVTVPVSTEVYNAATLAHLGSIAGVTGPLAVNRVLNAVYGAFAGGGGGVATIDGNADLLSTTFGAGITVSALAVNEATNMVYVGDATQGAVVVFQGVAPSPGAFTIGGRVVNGSGAGLAGITVVSQGSVRGSTVTDSNGLFTLMGFPAGTYTIQPTSAGLLYGPASQAVTISTASVNNLAFTGLATPIAVKGIATDLAMIGPGVNANATVTINQPAPPGGIVLSLTSSNKAATVAKSVTVPAGSTSATFTVQGTGVSSVTAVTLTATYSGPFATTAVSGTGSISVSPTDSLKLTSATFSKSTQVLTVNATSTNSQAILSVILASNNSVLGVMSNLGGGNYSFQTVYTNGTPTSVNVKSNLGGQTGQGVKSVP